MALSLIWAQHKEVRGLRVILYSWSPVLKSSRTFKMWGKGGAGYKVTTSLEMINVAL